MTKDEALKLALEALEDALNKPMWDRPKMTKAITAIKEALAQPAQEPVAWKFYLDGCNQVVLDEDSDSLIRRNGTPLYTAPPKRPWVGLTDEEIDAIDQSMCGDREFYEPFARAIEAKLRELNT